ncbi:YceD family protein [Marinimicrobium sp. ARAG 43.8]|uniref:YceD family protein n=1 Tax=Marinimicrobium sp. ARAG 43.8 TaxID=3418719 RepID=UPI003CF30C48
MFSAPFDKPLPRQGDPRKFAQQGVHLAGYVPVSQLPRVRDLVLEEEGQVRVDLMFGISEEGKLVVQGSAAGDLVFTCQRCLGPVTLPVEADIGLALVRTEMDAKQLPRSMDPWLLPEEGNTELFPMVEEELLLSMPSVAFHDHPCIDEDLLSSGEPVEPEPAENPFQVLKQLKGSPKK